MKRAFTTLGCPDWDIDTIAENARNMGFDGVELRGANGEHIGRAKAALVFGDGDEARAVISTVVARTPARASGQHIRFVGPGVFDEEAAEHILDVVLPVVDQICRGVGLRRRRFAISVARMTSR